MVPHVSDSFTATLKHSRTCYTSKSNITIEIMLVIPTSKGKLLWHIYIYIYIYIYVERGRERGVQKPDIPQARPGFAVWAHDCCCDFDTNEGERPGVLRRGAKMNNYFSREPDWASYDKICSIAAHAGRARIGMREWWNEVVDQGRDEVMRVWNIQYAAELHTLDEQK